MNFVALLLGLGIERLATRFFHLREFHWLYPLADRLSAALQPKTKSITLIGVVGFVVLAVLPVALISWLLSGTLFHIPYFLFSVFVLLFSLGPRDLATEVQDYCKAVRDDKQDDVLAAIRELRETEPPEDADAQIETVRRAIFVQANNRIFGVIFWFLILGPTGAWLFRVVDLIRRRLAREYLLSDKQSAPTPYVLVVRTMHGVLAWPSAHLLMFGYAMAGSFDGGLTAWRTYATQRATKFFIATNDMLDRVGNGAVTESPVAEGVPVAEVRVGEAMSLVSRTLWLVWAPVIALLTLSNWLS